VGKLSPADPRISVQEKMRMFVPPTRLGIGCPYYAIAPEVNRHTRDLIDFVEVSPDTLCHEIETERGPRMHLQPALVDTMLRTLDGVPITVHGLELSIGAASGWNEAYIAMLDEFRGLRDFAWHSEHLGYQLVADSTGELLNTGVPLPLPFTREAVDLVGPRAEWLIERYRDKAFLLENAVYYFPELPADPGWDEVVFLNQLVESSSCGLLLDLFNLYCNSVNHHFDLIEALSRLRLDRVVEVHLAGGKYVDGFILDGHCNVVPEPVWKALEWLIPRTPNLAGVVYEVLEGALPLVGIDRIRDQLQRLRSTWPAVEQWAAV
jgi:uncharacterized protein (UPF0276 family)